MRTTTRWTALLAALVLCIAASSASAQAPSDTETEALAEAQRGLAARRDGRDEEARQAFERSLALAPRASVQAQLGFALQALGRWVEAEATLAAAAELEDAWIDRHRATIDGALAEVRAHLGTLTLSVVPADATLRIDGVPTSAEVASRLPAGTVTISAQREGYYGTERVVVIRAGDTRRESFELRAREPEPTPTSDGAASTATDPSIGPTYDRVAEGLLAPGTEETGTEETGTEETGTGETRHWGGPATTMGVGALSLGAGLALLVARDSALAGLLSHGCVETPTEYVCASSDAAAARQSHADAESYAAASTTTLVAGGALLALGAGWLLVEWLRAPSAHDEAGIDVTPTGVRWTF
jgi:hypothetical protein